MEKHVKVVMYITSDSTCISIHENLKIIIKYHFFSFIIIIRKHIYTISTNFKLFMSMQHHYLNYSIFIKEEEEEEIIVFNRKIGRAHV